MHLFGVDITSKIRKSRMLAYLIQSEIWYRINENSTGDVSKAGGIIYLMMLQLLTGSLLGLDGMDSKI